MVLIRTQPFDDHDVRVVMMPNDCEMPCFIGIQPGVTTYRQAMVILESHFWVSELQVSDYAYGLAAGKLIQCS